MEFLKKLETWQIISIAIGILFVIGLIVYLMKNSKEDNTHFKKVLKDVTNKSDIKLASSSDNQAIDNTRVISKSVIDLYNDIGINICNKPLTPDFWQSSMLKNFPGSSRESLLFYVFLSDKLTEEKKKDFLTSLLLSNVTDIKLEGENIILVDEDSKSSQFFSGKNKLTITEFQNNLYNFILTIVDSNKIAELLRSLGKSESYIKDEMDNMDKVKIFINENSICSN